MRHLFLMGTILFPTSVLVSPTGALAHHHQVVRETCNAYRYTETYKPGHYLPSGTWVSGRVVQGQVEIPCPSSGTPAPVVAHHPHYTHSPVPVGQHQAQPLVVNNQSSAPQQQRCGGVIARMGLGGILGGVAGRYAVGGKNQAHRSWHHHRCCCGCRLGGNVLTNATQLEGMTEKERSGSNPFWCPMGKSQRVSVSGLPHKFSGNAFNDTPRRATCEGPYGGCLRLLGLDQPSGTELHHQLPSWHC